MSAVAWMWFWRIIAATSILLLVGIFRKKLKPGRLVIVSYREEFDIMTHWIIPTIQLPALSAKDIVKRQVSVDGPDGTSVIDVGLADTTFEVRVKLGNTIKLSLVDTDSSGNVSDPSVLDFTAEDKEKPPTPGPMTVLSIREEFTDD